MTQIPRYVNIINMKVIYVTLTVGILFGCVIELMNTVDRVSAGSSLVVPFGGYED